MMSYLDANLTALSAALGPGPAPPSDTTGRCSVEGAGEARVLYLTTSHGARLALNSARDPAAEARRTVERALGGSQHPGLVVLIGLGLGYTIDAVETLLPDARIIAVEPEPAAVRALLARRDFTQLFASNRLLLLWGPAYHGAATGWRFFDGVDSRLTLVHPVVAREYPDEVAAAVRAVEGMAFGAQANAEARRRFAGQYLLNTLGNLAVIAGSGDACHLTDAFTGTPAVIISAGPSLDQSLASLREVAGRALLIAVDTALRPLLSAGIAPHLVVAVDPGDANARHLTDLPDTRGAYLVAEGSVSPRAFGTFLDRVFTFKVSDHHPWPWLRTLGIERQVLRAWGSVAATSLDLAVRAGCDPIVFVGQDLAFTGHQPYCRNTTYETDWAEAAGRGTSLRDSWAAWRAGRGGVAMRDVSGAIVETSPSLVAVRDWLLAQCAQHPGRRFVNAGGAGILAGAGIELAPLTAALPSTGRPIAFEERLERAHGTSPRAVAAVRTAALELADALERQAQPTLSMTWREFTAGTVTEDDLVHALRRNRATGAAGAPALSVAAVPDWLIDVLRVLDERRGSFDVSRAAATATTWPPIGAFAERVEAIRSACWNDTPALQARSMPRGQSAEPLIGRATLAAARLLARPRLAASPAPGVVRGTVGLATGWFPMTALVTWVPEAWADIAAFEDCLCEGMHLARSLPLPPAPTFHDAAIAADDTDVTLGDGQPSRSMPVDHYARLCVVREWLHLVYLLDAAPGRAARVPAAHLRTPWDPAPGASAVAVEVTLAPSPAGRGGLPMPLTVAPYALMRHVTGYVAAPGAARDASRGRLLVGAVRCGLPDIRDVELRLHAVASLHPRNTPDPRDVFITAPPLLTVRPVILTERGMPGTQRCVALDDATVLATPAHGAASLRIAADATWVSEPTHDIQLVGEVPLSADGARVIWGHHPVPYVGVREAGGALRHTEPVPFTPLRPVVTSDGTVFWATDRGLWEWTPGGRYQRLADIPPCFGIRLVEDGCRLDPRFVAPSGHPIRRRDGVAWVWRRSTGTVEPVTLDALGPCWCSQARDGWQLDTYPHADIVRIVTPADRTFDLACFYPVQAAWAGPTLVVTTRHGDVLAFPSLAHALREAGEGRSQK